MKAGDVHPSKTHFGFCDVFWGALYANTAGGRNQHFSSNEALTLSQGQECQSGPKTVWTLNWKVYWGRCPAKAEGLG